MRLRTYHELIQIPDFKGRFEYLQLGGAVGDSTFGHMRFMNQRFYASPEWKRIRNDIIVRDSSGDYPLDLAHPDHPIRGRVIIHHMNPITLEMIENWDPLVYDPEYLILTTHDTHNAIHYGDYSLIPQDYVPRRPNDTIPWRM